MIQIFALAHSGQGRRRGAALLLAVILNLALLPCTMALEVADDAHHAHDCCPPKPQLDTSECCDLEDASVAPRGDGFTPDKEFVQAPLAELPGVAVAAQKHRAATDPPDPPATGRALHKLNCVYLK